MRLIFFVVVLSLSSLHSAFSENELWKDGGAEPVLESEDIQSLINAADKGDTILIEDGFYFEKLIFSNQKGTGNLPITLKAKTGHRVIVSAAEERWTRPNTGQWELAPEGFSNRGDIYRAVISTEKTHRLAAYLSNGDRLYSYGDKASDKARFIELDPFFNSGQGVYWEKDTGGDPGMGYVYIHLDGQLDPNTQPIFIPVGTSSKDQALRFWGSEWISVRNIDFRHGGFSTIKLQGSNNITIEDNKLFGGWVGISVNSGFDESVSSNNIIRRNEIADNYGSNWWWSDRKRIDGTAIKISKGGINNIIEYNDIYRFFNGIAVGAKTEKNKYNVLHNENVVIHNNLIADVMDDALEIEGYVSSGLIYENLITDAYVGLAMTSRWGADTIYFYRNRIHATKYIDQFDRDDNGPQSHNNPSVTKLGGGEDENNLNHPAENINLYNNTFFGTHYVVRGGFAAQSPTAEFPTIYPENFTWFNNIFYSVNGVLAQATGEANNGVVFDSNLYWQENKNQSQMEYVFRNLDTSFANKTNIKYYSLSDILDTISVPWEVSGLEAPPGFFNSDATNINDTLMPDSPAIDFGMDVDTSWPDTINAVNAVDIGALEVTPTVVLTGVVPTKAHPAGGASIIIQGIGFDGNTLVSIGGRPLDQLVLVSSSTIFGKVPPLDNGVPSLVEVVVSKGSVDSSLNTFEYSYAEWGDTDGDGVSDVVDDDIDGDGVNDDIENEAGTNPYDSTSTPLLHNGDVNNDNLVNAADLLIAMRIMTGQITATSLQLLKLDVAPLVGGQPSPDGQFTLGDYTVLLRKVTGVINF